MRILLLLATAFACSLMAWSVYSQPTPARSDKPATLVQRSNPQDFGPYQFDAVAEEKREEAALVECDKRVATKQLAYDDRLAFIARCLQAVESAHPRHQQ
jgi:hypothetical protein